MHACMRMRLIAWGAACTPATQHRRAYGCARHGIKGTEAHATRFQPSHCCVARGTRPAAPDTRAQRVRSYILTRVVQRHCGHVNCS